MSLRALLSKFRAHKPTSRLAVVSQQRSYNAQGSLPKQQYKGRTEKANCARLALTQHIQFLFVGSPYTTNHLSDLQWCTESDLSEIHRSLQWLQKSQSWLLQREWLFCLDLFDQALRGMQQARRVSGPGITSGLGAACGLPGLPALEDLQLEVAQAQELKVQETTS